MLDRLKKVLKTQAGMFYAILIAGVMLLGTSYSIFVLSTSSITTSEILVGNLLYSVSVYEEGSATAVSNRTVTVPASSSKSYYIVLASVNNTNSNFKLAYNASDSTGLTITASDRTGYDVSGLIGAYSTYGYKRIIKVNVENTGSAKTIEFNAFGGYNFNNVSKVNLGSGFTALAVSTESVATTLRSLVDQIEEDLNCTATESHACLYGPNDNANIINIKEIDNTDPNDPQEVEVSYHILGVYKLGSNDSDKVVKVVRSDVYEESTYTSANVESALSNFYSNILSDTFEKSQIYETNKFDCTRTNQDITSCASYISFNSNIGLVSADEYRVIHGYLNNTTTTDDHFVLDNINNETNVALIDLDDGTITIDTTTSSYIKPVFYLKNDTEVTGNGTSADPYTISLATTTTRYYSWGSGNINGNLPADKTKDPSVFDYNFYLGFDTEDDTTVSAAYVCFVTDKEYCLKGADRDAYGDNQDILREALPGCTNTSYCFADGLVFRAYSYGVVYVEYGHIVCGVDGNGTAECKVNSGGGGSD